MTISEHAEVFYSRPTKLFETADDWAGPDIAYRICSDYDSGESTFFERLETLLAQDRIGDLQALVIGAWQCDDSSRSSKRIVETLVAAKDQLTRLKALFLGDIIYEENEISWIEQSDVSPLLAAFPQLEVLRVRGGNSLSFSKITHKSLRQLIVETGGMQRSVLREICRCDFPSLDHLELWLGVDNYGFDGGVEDLQPILTGTRFPALRYLGLRNSEIVDNIAPVIVNSPVLKQLEVLDLSNGTLSDVGAQALLNLSPSLSLKKLDLSHHYMTNDMVNRLKKTLKCEVLADGANDPGEEWRSVVVSE